MNFDNITVLVSAIVLGLLNGYAVWMTKRNDRISRDHLKVVTDNQASIKRVLDGPLGLALMKLAAAKENVARLTLEPVDIASAEEARARSDEHVEIQENAGKEEVRAQKEFDRLKGSFK